jgi:molybdopterin-binding protein
MSVVDIRVTTRRGRFVLDAALSASAGETIAVVGPNGAGKSTLLRTIAGLEPCTGQVRIDGRDVGASPPHRRPIGWVPQDGALFPHLSALDNVAFGVGGRHGRQAAQLWLERLGVGDLAGRRPDQLSGGQAQKVALARALARRPRVLLLDEPLAALDVCSRADVRRSLRTHLSEFDGATLLVTHDPVDAATLADRLVAFDGGSIAQDGPVAEVSRSPRLPWLAALLGANAYPGQVRGNGVALTGGGNLVAADVDASDDAEVLAVFPSYAVTLAATRPRASARNVWPVVVTQLTTLGGRVRVHAEGEPPVVAEVTAAAVADLGLHEGSHAWASVKATEITVVVL